MAVEVFLQLDVRPHHHLVLCTHWWLLDFFVCAFTKATSKVTTSHGRCNWRVFAHRVMDRYSEAGTPALSHVSVAHLDQF